MHLPRRSRSIALLVGLAIAGSSAVVPAVAAEAVTRAGDVTVSLPSTIVIDGNPVHVNVTSSALTDYFDKVYVTLYNGTDSQGTDEVKPNKQFDMSTVLMKPGTIVGRASLATTYCSIYSNDRCHLDSDFNWYQFVDGLNYTDSAPATAKYGSKITLSAVNDGKRTTWTASAQQYGGYSWQPWKGASVTIGPGSATTDDKGIATWVETTSELHTFAATTAESTEVWASTSTEVQPTAPLKPAPSPSKKTSKPDGKIRLRSSSSATSAGRAVADEVSKVRKVVKLTKRNDANHLLGKKRGYQSAAVLVDRRLRCKGEPGVDCGATIEKFASASKARQRKRYIQTILHALPALGREHDEVHGRFLLRVSGKLSSKSTTVYAKAFRAAF